ncbi:hypothetical protein LINPERPRIM_LOCUS13330 [Linum perenne]
MCWNIWKARNDLVFNGSKPCTTLTGSRTSSDLIDWRLAETSRTATSASPQVPLPHGQPVTNPPPSNPNWVIHCDGSFVSEVQKAAYGVTISNTSGQITDGRAGTLYCSSPIVSEAAALHEAAKLTKDYPGTIKILSDCLQIVNAINGSRHRWPWKCYGHLGGVDAILKDRPDIEICYIPRRFNSKADWIARSAQSRNLPRDWIQSL